MTLKSTALTLLALAFGVFLLFQYNASQHAAALNRLKVSSYPFGVSGVRYWFLTHLKPALNTDANAMMTSGSNRRTADGKIITTVWNNNRNALEIDWTNGTAIKGAHQEKNWPLFDELDKDPREQPAPWLRFAFIPPDHKVECIGIGNPIDETHEKFLTIPFAHAQYMSSLGFASRNYPIGALPKIDNETMTLESILVVDVLNGSLLGEIARPDDAHSGAPYFILDKENDVLLAIHFNLDWVMAMDLQPYVKKLQEKK
jgi:hypothetical protein